MNRPYRLKISKGIYHVGNGKGGGINVAIKYRTEDLERIKNNPLLYYMEHGWKIMEIKKDGELSEVFMA
jgi:hypothetical protein